MVVWVFGVLLVLTGFDCWFIWLLFSVFTCGVCFGIGVWLLILVLLDCFCYLLWVCVICAFVLFVFSCDLLFVVVLLRFDCVFNSSLGFTFRDAFYY